MRPSAASLTLAQTGAWGNRGTWGEPSGQSEGPGPGGSAGRDECQRPGQYVLERRYGRRGEEHQLVAVQPLRPASPFCPTVRSQSHKPLAVFADRTHQDATLRTEPELA